MSEKPIFYDQSEKRRPIVKRALMLIFFVIMFLIICFWLSIYINPYLPKANFLIADNKTNKFHYKKIANSQNFQISKKRLFSLVNNKTWFVSSGDNLVDIYAFYVERDDNSFSSLKTNLSKIDVLLPERLNLSSSWLNFLTPDKANQTLQYIRANRNDIKILPLVNNFDEVTNSWSNDNVYNILSDPTRRSDFSSQIISYIDKNSLDGISIDFENLDSKTWLLVEQWLKEIRPQIKANWWDITINVPLSNDSIPYTGLAENTDKLILMAYDEHRSSSQPGPISSMNRYESWINDINKIIDPSKYIIALGNYWYDRVQNTNQSDTLTWQEAVKTMYESSWEINYDQNSLNPMFEYYDENNIIHKVRYLDATTIYNQFVLWRNAGQGSFALWRLWSEDPAMRSLIDNHTLDNDEKPITLQNIENGYDIDYVWSGLLLKLWNIPTTWSREIDYDKDSWLITNQKIINFPTPYIINRYWPISNKKILLTFDDWPSTYTPQILDILKQYKVPATFFVIWGNVEQYPEILQRAFNEWHMIWSHTFTHPDISLISSEQLDLELNTTQRIIQAITDHSTILFRPPYSVDIEPRDSTEAQTLITLWNLGYYIVWLNIDPNDRQNPWTDKILSRTLSLAGSGGVLLLHDWGWDRSQTVKALPMIIQSLQKQWYTFVSAQQAFWLSGDTLMPKLQNIQQIISFPNRFIFHASNTIWWIIYYIFFIWIIIWLSRLLLIIVLAFYQKYKIKKQTFDKNYRPLVSVLVPAYNEWVVIIKTINNLLQSEYISNLEILLIDDWSKDDTLKIAKENFGQNPKINIISQENSGKAMALNNWINHAKWEIIIVQDADTIFNTDAIWNLVRHFANKNIWAVAGNVKVWNLDSFMWRCQALEYMTSQNLDRRAFDVLNCITVVPWAIGARRKTAVIEVWWLSSQTLAEDSDLTVCVLRNWRKIAHEQDAIAWTEAPDSISGFTKQRFRWMFGTLQMMRKHSDMLFSFRQVWLWRFALPNLFIFQIVFPLLSPILDLIWFINIFVLVFHLFSHYSQTVASWNLHTLIYYLIFLWIDTLVTIITFWMEKEKNISLVLRFPLQKIVYRFLMYWVWLKVIYTAMTWKWVWRNKLIRKWTVNDKNINN